LAQADQEEQILKRHFFDMNTLLSEIIQETRIIAPNHEVDLMKNDHALVYADLTYLKEMIRIFIENSIKYTPEKGKITVSSVRFENYLEILIQDTGIGISEEDQEKIFDRFYRSDASRSKSSGGIGLGLAIAKWIAEKHEIALSVFSDIGKGTTVIIKVPLYEEEEIL
jgi:signal transduction histidine kinase